MDFLLMVNVSDLICRLVPQEGLVCVLYLTREYRDE